MKEIDLKLLNKEYNGFKILEIFYEPFQKNYNNRRRARCICDCGKEFTCRAETLKRRKGCCECRKVRGGITRIKKDFGAAKKAYYNSYKRNARIRDIEFKLSPEEFNILTTKQCYYCGTVPQDQSYLSVSTRKYSNKFYANGVDRIYNNKGYTLENSVPCCTKCNMMKKVMSCDEFLHRVTAIYEYQTFDVNNIIENNE